MTKDWEEAAACVEIIEREVLPTVVVDDPLPGFPRLEEGGAHPEATAPLFADVADEYLRSDYFNSLAPTTQKARRRELSRSNYQNRCRGETGRVILDPLGHLPVDQVTVDRLREWWDAQSTSPKPRRNYLDAIHSVLKHARRQKWIEANPCNAFRQQLREDRENSKTARRARSKTKSIHPIEDPADLQRLLGAIDGAEVRVKPHGHPIKTAVEDLRVFVLLGLDAGLRIGEAQALRWGDVLGEHRLLDVSRSLSQGSELGDTKSGEARDVQLSARLEDALRELRSVREAAGPVRGSDRILPQTKAALEGAWKRLLRRAGIGDWKYKDLRTTFASQLLTHGVPLIEISQQLGHSRVSTTEVYYSKYIKRGQAGHLHLERREREVAADLLARLPDRSYGHLVSERSGDLGAPEGIPSTQVHQDEEQTAALH